MLSRNAFMFGYSPSTFFVAQELKNESLNFFVIVEDTQSYQKAIDDGYTNVIRLDMTNDEALERLHVQDSDYLICVMHDNHMNVFLTLSLHSLFPHAIIIALSDSFHTTQKLKMAGASRIIDLYQVSANRIHNILHKPVTTKLIERFLSPDENFSFKEMIVPPNSILDGVMVDDFDFSVHNIILVGMIDKRLSSQFIFITSGLENRFDVGDTLVCIGYNEDLDRFEENIK
jgi:voltage-gated potassium channel